MTILAVLREAGYVPTTEQVMANEKEERKELAVAQAMVQLIGLNAFNELWNVVEDSDTANEIIGGTCVLDYLKPSTKAEIYYLFGQQQEMMLKQVHREQARQLAVVAVRAVNKRRRRLRKLRTVIGLSHLRVQRELEHMFGLEDKAVQCWAKSEHTGQRCEQSYGVGYSHQYFCCQHRGHANGGPLVSPFSCRMRRGGLTNPSIRLLSLIY